jgi:general secretion pathway protein B
VVSSEEPGRRRSKAWLWVVIGISAGVLLPLLWRWWSIDPAPEEAAGARAAVVAGSVTPPSAAAASDMPPAAAPAPASEPPAAHTATPSAQERPRAPPAAHTAPKAAASAKAASTNRQDPASRQTNVAAAAPKAHSASGASAAPAPVVASAPEPRLRSLAELPEELRRSVPQLAFGGSVYSEIATQRMVIFNGQVLREGDAVTDELLLEQIRPHSAVMRLRGQRFEVAF